MSEITQPVKKRPANEISAPSAAKQAKANAPKKRAGSNNAPATIIGLTEETEYVAAVPAVVAAPSLIAAPSPSLPVPMAAPRTSTTSSSATPIITSENHVIEQNKKVLGQLPNGDYRKKCKFCKNKTSYYCTTCTVDGGRVAYCCKADTDCFKTVHGTISGAENDDDPIVHVLERNRVIITGRNNGDYRCRCSVCNNKTSYYCTKCSTPEQTVFICKYGTECFKAHNLGIDVARNPKKSATDYVVYGANSLSLGENDQVVRGPNPDDHALRRNKLITSDRPNGDYRKRCHFCPKKTSFYCVTCSSSPLVEGEIFYCCKVGSECYINHHSNTAALTNSSDKK